MQYQGNIFTEHSGRHFLKDTRHDLPADSHLIESAEELAALFEPVTGVIDTVQIAFKLGSSETHLGFCIKDPRAPQALKLFAEGMAKIKKDGPLESNTVQLSLLDALSFSRRREPSDVAA